MMRNCEGCDGAGSGLRGAGDDGGEFGRRRVIGDWSQQTSVDCTAANDTGTVLQMGEDVEWMPAGVR